LITGRWITALKKAEAPKRATLLCLHYAGGSSGIFRHWDAALPPGVDLLAVDLPGRAARFGEPLIFRLESVVDGLLAALQRETPDITTRPLILFGHSMGALIGFELARQLGDRTDATPAHLIVSGAQAPSLPHLEPPCRDLPKEKFIAELKRMGGTDDAILQNDELLDVLEPMLRADFTIAETYQPQPGAHTLCDITALGGECDPFIKPERIRAWSVHTSGAFDAHMFAGGHFFINEQKEEVLDVVRSVIDRTLNGDSNGYRPSSTSTRIGLQ
jgi:medium-chain acyl-[acyl-carrier-protein] hydrolase